MRIAFYAPLNEPHGATPSGDRLMARQIIAALTCAGHTTCQASTLRTWLRDPEPALMAGIEREAALESARLIAGFEASPTSRPDLWLTYHLYYKAPDLLGPAIAQALTIPYVAIEASHARKRESGPYANWAHHARHALQEADLLIAMTDRDRAGLRELQGRQGGVAYLPPFLADPGPEPPERMNTGEVKLVTVAMMRPGVKVESYALLAAALTGLPRTGWTLEIIGDGPSAAKVRALFADDARVRFRGQLHPDAVRAALKAADIFVWPGIGEAYGMVYLEAAAAGLPSLAMSSGGVPEVVIDGATGLLSPERDVDIFTAHLVHLIQDVASRGRLGRAGRALVTDDRGLQAAAHRLDNLLTPLRRRRGHAA